LIGQGLEARTLTVSRTSSQVEIPIGSLGGSSSSEGAVTTGPLTFVWTDGEGRTHSLSPKFTERGLQLPSSVEDLPDFFLFPAGPAVGSVENATRLSDLRKARRDRQFVELITQEYDWIEDLSIEVSGGSPCIFASVKGLESRIALSDVSGGINRSVSFLLAMASKPRSVVLIDEIDSGLYHTHHVGLWRAILRFARSYDSQLFVTTHNEEWLEALFEAASTDVGDIALWRFERRLGIGQPKLLQFSGRQVGGSG
jgi:acyl-CoA hydrolase